jgi:hypothetical protein
MACDDHGGCDQDAATIQALNLPPIVSAGPDQNILSGDAAVLDITFSDAGTEDDPWTYSIRWGDSSTGEGTTDSQADPLTAQHTFLTPAEYGVEVCITDKDGGIGCDSAAVIVAPRQVDIDIKPGGEPNCINNNGHGSIPVAILSDADFDATAIDAATVFLDGQPVRGNKKGKLQAHVADVDGDGLDDLMVQIQDIAGTYGEGDTYGTLVARTMSGIAIEGTDTICLVPHGGGRSGR